MGKNDWYEAGDQIKKLVQDAVDSGDFSQLGNTISNVVNETVNSAQEKFRKSFSGDYSQGEQTQGEGPEPESKASKEPSEGAGTQTNRSAGQGNGSWGRGGWTFQNAGAHPGQESAERIRQNLQRRRAFEQKEKAQAYSPVRARVKEPGETGGKIMKHSGSCLMTFFGILFLITAAAGITAHMIVGMPLFVLGLFCALGVFMRIRGNGKISYAQRYRRYLSLLGNRTFCSIDELAAGIGQDSWFVRKDLKKMIAGGLFPEGYIDPKGTLLITDKETYQQYRASQESFEKRRADQDAKGGQQQETSSAEPDSDDRKEQRGSKEAGKEASANPAPEHQRLIEEGESYIRHIHECNEKIPDEVMSAKLDRMELVVTRIFREAGKHPDTVSDLRRMMSYYLPTTRKLLDAYCDLASQPIKGQNIESTKKEIEDAIDKLNTAFENLLDGLFEEQAWDISSDISVLNTMLAQEGLTGSDFDPDKKKQ